MRAEIVGLPVALVVLIVVFGALLAAGVPLVVAIASIIVTAGLTTVVGQISPQSEIIFNMIVMIGLTVGIDYALFIVERYREVRRHGRGSHKAVVRAGDTASTAVLFSGMTVVIALTGMFLIPVSVFGSPGIGEILVVLVSVLAAMTVIPAILALLGDRNWCLQNRLGWLPDLPGRRAASGEAGTRARCRSGERLTGSGDDPVNVDRVFGARWG